MKILIFTLFILLTHSAKSQTAEINTIEKRSKTTTADIMISIPMIGNINIKDCEENMQEDLKPLIDMKVIKIDDAIYFYTEQSIVALSHQEEKKSKVFFNKAKHFLKR